MSVQKALNKEVFLEFSTVDPIPLEAIATTFESAGLSSEIRVLYRHIAELVCNIYEHSSPEAYEKVNWSLSGHWDGRALVVTIKDQGQGIYKSISPLFDKPLSPLESLNLAVNRHNSPFDLVSSYRGLGLKGIIRAVAGGAIESFQIESDGYLFCCTDNSRHIKKTHKAVGTKVQLTLRFNGGVK
jgi:hypothetical protein